MSLIQQQVPYFLSGQPETEEYTSAAGLYAKGLLGMLCDFDQGTPAARNLCRYQLVQQDTGIQGVVGTVFYWKSTATKGQFVVTTVRTNQGMVAGVGQIAAANSASFIYILKHGQRSVKLQGAPTSAADATGKPLVPSTSADGVADCLAAATAPYVSLIGVAVGAAVASVAPAMVNIPDAW